MAVAAPDQPLDKDDLGVLIAGVTAKALILNGQRDEIGGERRRDLVPDPPPVIARRDGAR